MLWPLPASATLIHWHLLFRLFCTPFSLTKALLTHTLLCHAWGDHLVSYSCHFSCLLTLQRFYLLFPCSLSCFLVCLPTLFCHNSSHLFPASVLQPAFILVPAWVQVIPVLQGGELLHRFLDSWRSFVRSMADWERNSSISRLFAVIQPRSPLSKSVLQTSCPGDPCSLQDPFFPSSQLPPVFSWPCLTMDSLGMRPVVLYLQSTQFTCSPL